MDSFDDTKRYDPQNPADPVGASESEDGDVAAKAKAHLSLSQMKLDFSKKRVTPLQRRVSDRTNRFLKSYVNPPQLDQEDVNQSATGEMAVSSTGVDLANFFQEKLLSTEDTPSVPDEVEENLLDYQPKKPSRKVSAGEVFRQELRASKQRGALERLKQEVREESTDETLGREAVTGEFDIPPFTSSEETESVPMELDSEENEVDEQAPPSLEEPTNSTHVFTEEEKAHLAKIREMAPEKSDPGFPFPSYLDENLNPKSSRVEVPASESQTTPPPEVQELPPFPVKPVSAPEEEADLVPGSARQTQSEPPPASDGQVLFERKPRVSEEGRSGREIYSRDPGDEKPAERAQTVWTRPEAGEPVSQTLEQEPEVAFETEPELETVPEPIAIPEPESESESAASEPEELMSESCSKLCETTEPTPTEPVSERKPRVFRRSRISPEEALSAPSSPRENLEEIMTQSLSGKGLGRSASESPELDNEEAEPRLSAAEGESQE